MKKIFALLMTIMMCFSAASVVQAEGNNITVLVRGDAVRSKTISMTVALSNCDNANTLGISFEYDTDVLTMIPSECQWLKEAAISDIDEINYKGIWAVEEKTDVNGEICKFTFRVNPNAELGNTEVKYSVTVKEDSKVIGTYDTTAAIEVVDCVHDYSGEWTSKDSEVHIRLCDKCGVEKAEAHTWDNGKISKEPTQTEAGKKVYTCTMCKATREEEIPATGVPVTPTPEPTPVPEPTPEPTPTPDVTPTPDITPIPDYTPFPGYTPVPDDETLEADNKQQKPKPKPSNSETVLEGENLAGTEVTGVKMDEAVVETKVKEIQNAESGTEFVIDMKNPDNTIATVVPVEILEAVKGKDVNVVLDMGEYSWTINGLDVSSNLKDINLEVLLGTKAIDESAVKEIAGEDETYQLTLQHNGEFGFRAFLKLNLGTENAGKFGNLYHYDNNKKFVFMNAGLIDENGDVSLKFTHASDYLIVIGEERTEDTVIAETEFVEDTEVIDTDNTGSNEAEKSGNGGTIAIVVALIAVVAAAVLFMKKKNK